MFWLESLTFVVKSVAESLTFVVKSVVCSKSVCLIRVYRERHYLLTCVCCKLKKPMVHYVEVFYNTRTSRGQQIDSTGPLRQYLQVCTDVTFTDYYRTSAMLVGALSQ